ncbi:hypothetical protein [Streptomyces sp. NPDC018711]|uniref:hypothetical protein n=1 Tax=Streptomyces sp. NPDC018711 TaxID=3365052 RepID=UPI0037A63A6F
MNDHDMKTLLRAGLDDEPPLGVGVDELVTAGRRRRLRRRGAFAVTGVTAGAAVFALALTGAGTGASPEGPDVARAADPLVGPLVPAAAETAAQPLRPDGFGSGTEHRTKWDSRRLADTLVGLLPSGRALTREGDFPGRTYRVQWDGGTGPVQFVGGAGYTDKEPDVPLCAQIALPKVSPRPGAPAPGAATTGDRCEVVHLADGARAEVVTVRAGGKGRTSWYVRVLRRDGRTVTLQEWQGRDASRPEPAVPTAELLKIANDPAWAF